MHSITLKSALKFWHELVFVIPIGGILIENARWVILSKTLDRWDIFVLSALSFLLVFIIGQFFWKHKTLAVILAVLLGISSVLVVFMALYGIFNSPSFRTESMAMLIIGVILISATFKMASKYAAKQKFLKA